MNDHYDRAAITQTSKKMLLPSSSPNLISSLTDCMLSELLVNQLQLINLKPLLS